MGLEWRSRWDLHPHSSRRQRVAFLFSYESTIFISSYLDREVHGLTEITESRDSRADSPNAASFVHELSFTAAPSPHGLVGQKTLKSLGSAGNAPVRRFRHMFRDARFTVEQPDHSPEIGSGGGSC